MMSTVEQTSEIKDDVIQKWEEVSEVRWNRGKLLGETWFLIVI